MTLLQQASNVDVESHRPSLADRLLAMMDKRRDREIGKIHQACNEHRLYWCFCRSCRDWHYRLAVMNRKFGPNTLVKEGSTILDTYKYAV